MKKLFAIILPIVLLTSAVAGYMFTIDAGTTLGYVSVDINPSVQFVINEDDEVIGVSASNDDGETILIGETDALLNMSIEEATERIVELAIEFGYMDPDALETDPNAVTITTLLDNEDAEEESQLRSRIKERLENYFRNNGVFGVVMTDIDMNAVVTEAQDLGISAGKLKLIRTVQAAYPEFTLEQGLNTEVKEMMTMLQDLRPIQTNIQDTLVLIEEYEAQLVVLNDQLVSYATSINENRESFNALNILNTLLMTATQLEEHDAAIQVLNDAYDTFVIDRDLVQVDFDALQVELDELNSEIGNIQTRLAMLEQARSQKGELVRVAYENWQAERSTRSANVQSRWEQFNNGLTEEQKLAILEAMQNNWNEEVPAE